MFILLTPNTGPCTANFALNLRASFSSVEESEVYFVSGWISLELIND